jgi:hypothetical protein
VALPATLVVILHRFRRINDDDAALPEHDLDINISVRNFGAAVAFSSVLPPREHMYDLTAFIDYIPNGPSDEHGGKTTQCTPLIVLMLNYVRLTL